MIVRPPEKAKNAESIQTDSSPKKLRILFVSHTYVVGVNQGKLEAIAHTNQADVGLLVPDSWKALSWNQIFSLERVCDRVEYYPANVLFNGKTGGYFYGLGSLIKAFRHYAPDILQVEEEVFSLSTFQMAIAARVTDTPLVVFGWENMDRTLSKVRQWTRKFVLDTAKLIVAGNQDGANLLRRWGYAGNIAIMPQMGVDPDIFAGEVRSHPKDRPFQIGFMGRLVHEKGIDILFSAAQTLKEKGHRFEIVLCGSGSDEVLLKKDALRKGIADCVVWKGKVSHADVPAEMVSFDSLVLPSRTVSTWKEQFGHVLIEAMSMGIPVVGSNSGEIPNVIDNPAQIFPENDAAALSAVLDKIMSDRAAYKTASQKGLERVSKHYTHKRIAEKLVSEWTKVADESKR